MKGYHSGNLYVHYTKSGIPDRIVMPDDYGNCTDEYKEGCTYYISKDNHDVVYENLTKKIAELENKLEDRN